MRHFLIIQNYTSVLNCNLFKENRFGRCIYLGFSQNGMIRCSQIDLGVVEFWPFVFINKADIDGMRTASEIMTPNPKMIASGDSLTDVIKLFIENGITSSPVINPIGEILGVLTELSLVKAYMLHKAKFNTSDRVGHHTELFEVITYINEQSPLADVLKVMVNSPTKRLLVKDSSDKIVGIISPKDIMRAILGTNGASQNIREKLVETEGRLKETLNKVESMEKHLEVYRKVFHETPYVMHAVDENGIIIMANKREHELLGYKEGELIGKSMYDLYAEPMHEAAARGLKAIIDGGHQNVTYTSLRHHNGTTIRCDIASSSMRDRHGKFLSTISVLRPMDSEELLRILNGIVDDKDGPLSRYAAVKDHKED